MSIDAVPESIDRDEVLSEMNEVEGVKDVHHLHIWPISTTETALTAHVVVAGDAEPESVVAGIKHHLRHAGISHATIETEREGSECPDHDCC
jgi:cobalt-zinc-cadmium efflux system protein